MNDKTRATVEFPKEIWRNFMVYVKAHDTTASALIRDFVETTLKKAGKGKNLND